MNSSAIRVGLFAATIAALAAPHAACAQAGVSAASVQAGSRLFRDKGCITCHAVRGFGGTVGPDLARISGARSFFGFAAAMWNHVPQMARTMRERGVTQPHLEPWEAGDLVAFLFWLGYFDGPGDTARGRELFTSKQCIRCHQFRGVGGVVGPSLDDIGASASPIHVAAAMWDHAPAMRTAMAERGVTRPNFTGGELRDLLAYLRTDTAAAPTTPVYVAPGRADVGKTVFEERGCVKCHRVGSRGGTVGPDLGADVKYSSVLDFAAAMWNKVPLMLGAMSARGIAVPTLTDQDMADLVAYFYAARYFGGAGTRERGASIVRQAGCLTCHALRGRGGRTARDLAEARGVDSPAGVVAALWNHVALPASETGATRWASLTPAQVADVAAFLESLGGGP